MALQEIRARNSPTIYPLIVSNLKLEKDENYYFSQDCPILDLHKGDILIAVQLKTIHVDIRKKPPEEIDSLLLEALQEKFIVFRIIRKNHPDAEKLINQKTVRLH